MTGGVAVLTGGSGTWPAGGAAPAGASTLAAVSCVVSVCVSTAGPYDA